MFASAQESVQKKAPLRVVLCWHMHQPQYRDHVSGEYHLPWTYLHAIKDYVDMAAHLESVPGARSVVNFAPVLLDQIDDYASQIRHFLDTGSPISDPVLEALADPAKVSGAVQRLAHIQACLKANEERLINRFPVYRRLVDIASQFVAVPETVPYLDEQFIADLTVWYHLAWMGETVRRDDARIKRLMDQESMYSAKDRLLLMQVIGELLSEVLPRYRKLAEEGKVELAMSPFAHPIVPLLLDFEVALEAMPEAPLPLREAYPGGRARSAEHIRQGREAFIRHFGKLPEGCWPSEGAISEETLTLLGEAGFGWAASGETVLRNSLGSEAGDGDVLHRPYRLSADGPVCFFRDDGLSDLIGFTYSKWHADDAVANLVGHLETIAVADDKDDLVVSIILDGENAWEYYPENGFYFLSALYEQLAEHADIELTTYADCLKKCPPVQPLERLVAGSWVYGTLSTWIGESGKNRGWEMLVDAKAAYDRVMADGALDADAAALAERQLSTCEGSDWFWWFGDYNPAETVSEFDGLFRRHLKNLYQLLQLPVPDELEAAFTFGGGEPDSGGVMRRGQ